MRRKFKIFIIYFPIILVSCQIIVNLLSFIIPKWYNQAGFVLNTLFGVNLLFAVFLLSFTYWFKFCAVSMYSAWAEILFAANYLIIQEDNLYNILFQVIVGIIALLLTFRYFIKRFPLCSLALIWRFFKSVGKTGSCSKGLEMWEKNTYHTIKAHHESRA